MPKYKVIFDGDEPDEVFDTEEDAEEHAMYLQCTFDPVAALEHKRFIGRIRATMTMMRIPLKPLTTKSLKWMTSIARIKNKGGRHMRLTRAVVQKILDMKPANKKSSP